MTRLRAGRGPRRRRPPPPGARDITTLAIYALALLVCLLAGVAATALLAPSGRWVHHWAIPLGLCVMVVLLYPLAQFMPVEAAAPIALALCAAVLAAAAVRRHSARAGRAALREAFLPARTDLWVAAAGIAGGVLFLIPVLMTGFPTVLAITNNDAWYYAGLVDWLTHNAAGTAVVPSFERPLEASVTIMKQSSLPYGFELFASTLQVLTGRMSFEVVGAAAAVGVPAVVSGWARLAEVVAGRARAIVVAAAVAATVPMLVLTYAENYLTHFTGLTLVPLAVATAAALFAAPSGGALVMAALASGGLIGVYVGVLPWQVFLVVAAAIAVTGPWPARAGRPRGRVARAALLLVALGVVTAVLSPVAAFRAYEFSTLASGFSEGGPFQAYPAKVNLSLLFGVIPSTATDPGALAALGALVILAAAVVAMTSGRLRPAPVPLALLAAVLAATGLVFTNYSRSGYNYGTYKTMISGGALLAGVVVVGLLARAVTRRTTIASLVALVLCALVWVPSAVSLLRDVDRARPGFREDDRALGEALADLPEGSRVLVEGADAGGSPDQFQLRMMTAYFATTNPNVVATGIWSTPSYMSPGPLPMFRPSAAWDYVLTARPSPFGAGRTTVWRSGVFRLAESPDLDVTEYGPYWYGPEREGGGWFQWISGPSELVVGNRTTTARRARLQVTLGSYAVARTATLTAEADVARARVPARGATVMRLDLVVPPGGTRVVVLDATPPASPAPPGDPRTLMLKVRDVRVLPASPSPSMLPAP